MLPFPTVMTPSPNTVFLTANGLVLGIGQTNVGTFRFLKDHYIDGNYYLAGEVLETVQPWTPTPDVEPLEWYAYLNFYAMGPTLGGVIRTHFSSSIIYAPITYWRSVSPNLWELTDGIRRFDPVPAIPERVRDKEF